MNVARKIYVVLTALFLVLLPLQFLFAGYGVFGLETTAFTCLVLAGTLLFMREEEAGAGVPWSGLCFAAAGLSRPEAPLFLGVLMLFLAGRPLLELQKVGATVRTNAYLSIVETESIYRELAYRLQSYVLAQKLVGANLAGHDSHGVIRVPQYVEQVEAGPQGLGPDRRVDHAPLVPSEHRRCIGEGDLLVGGVEPGVEHGARFRGRPAK
mgnify:CR=1 FL=1